MRHELSQQTLKLKMPRFQESDEHSEDRSDPNIWFVKQFPEATRLFGPAFLVGHYEDANTLPHQIPLELNEDAWAWALSGDRRLGHRVVYFRPENQFYFFDPCLDAWCPTTEDKLQALLSHYLIRCSQEVGSLVDIRPLVADFREKKVLKRVLARAKALLEAEDQFFSGPTGQRRFIGGKLIEPNEPPPYQSFIQTSLIPESDGMITVTDCFHKYYRYCKDLGISPPTRTEFTAVVSDAIRAAFNIGMRHDVVSANGKQTNGWRGIAYRGSLTSGTVGCN